MIDLMNGGAIMADTTIDFDKFLASAKFSIVHIFLLLTILLISDIFVL